MIVNNKTAADGLKVLLADSYVLYIKVQGFHWNVTGPMFVQLHGLFGDMYEDLSGAVDMIAERIRALGYKAPGSMKEFGKLTNIEEASGEIACMRMVAELARDQEKLVKCCTEALHKTDAMDIATIDVLTKRTYAHQKFKWFLDSLKP